MSRRMMIISMMLGLAAMLLPSGCEQMHAGKKMACPGCGAEMTQGSYCSKCQMMVTDAKGMGRCGCNMEMKVGKYCKACNQVAMNGEAKCPGCGAMMKAGKMCDHCKMYAGACKSMKYCDMCKMPYNGDKCPVCNKT